MCLIGSGRQANIRQHGSGSIPSELDANKTFRGKMDKDAMLFFLRIL